MITLHVTKRTVEETPATSSSPYKKARARMIVSALPRRLQTSNNADENDIQAEQETSPQQYIMETLRSKGCTHQVTFSLRDQAFFSAPTDEEISAYCNDVLTAVRTRDIKKLRELHATGRPLKCSNQFGESLLHLACRRSFGDVASFLVKEAGVTVRVRDDYGRTPLHDACWTCEPNFELLELIIKECPELLFVRDRRGHMPLEYARREHWSAYVEFFSQRHDLFVGKIVKTAL